MKVYALVGESGSGKSYRATVVSYKYKIKYIIDDGLLIGNGKILAGSSAKREKTSMASVKRAIFMYDDSREDVKAAIEKLEDASILILGTSKDMVDLIAKRVNLPEIEKYINIRDISTEEEINFAKTTRKTEGKHVIPVPAFEVKKSFSGYFIDPLKVFFKFKDGPVVADKTIVRPTYSYMGDYILSKGSVVSIIRYEVGAIKGTECREVRIVSADNGVMIYIDIIIDIRLAMRHTAKIIQKRVKDSLENMAGLMIIEVNIRIASLK